MTTEELLKDALNKLDLINPEVEVNIEIREKWLVTDTIAESIKDMDVEKPFSSWFGKIIATIIFEKVSVEKTEEKTQEETTEKTDDETEKVDENKGLSMKEIMAKESKKEEDSEEIDDDTKTLNESIKAITQFVKANKYFR